MKLLKPFIKIQNKPVISTFTPEMLDKYNQKFKDWDKVVRTNQLESKNPTLRAQAYQMLKDPTIYAYAFFRNIEDPELPLVMYPYQDLVLNDDSDRVFFAASNQIGKSVTLDVDALHFAIFNPGTTQLVLSKSLPQSKDLMRQIKQLLQFSTVEHKYDIGESETKTELSIKHIGVDGLELPESRIIVSPATGSALGYPCHKVHLDEVCFYQNGRYILNQIIIPRTFATKGQIKAYSNPNGQQGVGWDMWNDSQWSKYNFNFLDRPGNTLDEWERHRKSMNREEFDSTVAAQFTSAEGAFLSLDERRRIQHERPNVLPAIFSSPLFVFFDFAKVNDRTVRIIGQSIGSVTEPKVFVHEMKEYLSGTGYDEVVRDLVNLIHDVGTQNVALVGWDNTGVGKGIEDFINKIQEFGVGCSPVEFSLQNKSRIYTLFKFLIEQDRIDIPYVEECDKQFSTLRFKKSEGRRYWQVHHENEKDRDDFPDCLAGLCSLIIQPDSPAVTATII